MMRSLWTAASGMIAQQTNVDTISNNLANVNTIGYKTEVAEFKTLLYQTIQTKTTSANGEQKPISAQVGLGTRNSSITSKYTNGTFTATGNNTDIALNGSGFFALQGIDGEIYYTRNGSFNFAKCEGGSMLCNSEGLPVLDIDMQPIIIEYKEPSEVPSLPEEGEEDEIDMSKITINASGEICYPDEKNNPKPIGKAIGLFQFSNPAGLEKMGSSLLKETAASGSVIVEAYNPNAKKTTMKQGYVEASNVQVVDEMVNLIVAQRAYELNSKAIQASDDMLQLANNLKR